jgi:O-antigen/teichoic acid export membrane protein
VAAGLAVGQVLSYALNVVAARVLGPAEFGALGALLGLVVVANVAALAVQATTARRGAQGEDAGAQGSAALVVALTAGGLMLVACTAMAPVLRLDLVAVGAVALVTIPLTLLGWVFGSAQGEQRFGALALAYAIAALLRVGSALAALLVTQDVTAVAGATLIGAVLGWILLHRTMRLPWPSLSDLDRPARDESFRSLVALLAMFALTSVDVLLARALLPAESAGQYAAGAILVKIAFWLPQAVVVSAYPRLAADEPGTLRRASLLMALLGAVGVVLALLLGPFVVPPILGTEYVVAAGAAWLFVLAGVVQSLAYLVVYDRLAVQDRMTAVVVWSGVGILVVLAATVARSPESLAWCVVASSGAIALAGLLRRRGRARVAA